MTLKVIAYARNGHTDKFGIPRQSREGSPILTRIVFEPEYSVAEALRGIEGYSHLWLLWGFSEISRCRDVETSSEEQRTKDGLDWSPTVRPPRLGGNKRMGVFATRSPYRPNPIGLSSVRLVGIRLNEKLKIKNEKLSEISRLRDFETSTEKGTIELIVSGADVLDGTPIYDIKPYLSFSDSHPEAMNGFAEETKNRTFKVVFQPGVDQHLLSTQPGNDTVSEICYILSQDPRPGYQDDPEREYKMDYAGWTVTFCVKEQEVIVKKMEKKQK